MTTAQPGCCSRKLSRKQKYTVVAVTDGAAALKKDKEGKFDLVLMDVWMPKLNGLQVLSKLKNVKKRPKIVVMTSDDTPETLLGAIRKEKPIRISRSLWTQRRWWFW